jgi:hypothetical protein
MRECRRYYGNDASPIRECQRRFAESAGDGLGRRNAGYEQWETGCGRQDGRWDAGDGMPETEWETECGRQDGSQDAGDRMGDGMWETGWETDAFAFNCSPCALSARHCLPLSVYTAAVRSRCPPSDSFQRPDSVVAESTKRLDSRFYQVKTGHCLTG